MTNMDKHKQSIFNIMFIKELGIQYNVTKMTNAINSFLFESIDFLTWTFCMFKQVHSAIWKMEKLMQTWRQAFD